VIRRLKYVKREESSLYAENFPPHSCFIWIKRSEKDFLFKEDTDRILMIDPSLNIDYDKIVEFVLFNNGKNNSNTTFYCEDYTISMFFNSMLNLWPGRFHIGAEIEPEKVNITQGLNESYSKYILDGII